MTRGTGTKKDLYSLIRILYLGDHPRPHCLELHVSGVPIICQWIPGRHP